MNYKKLNAMIKMHLALVEGKPNTMQDLAEAAGITYSGLYQKLKGIIGTKDEEKVKINEYLELTANEAKAVWQED